MKIINVNRGFITQNRKNGTEKPVITVRDRKGDRTIYCNEVLIKDVIGDVVARVVYNPNNPLKCGAVVWIEAYGSVETDMAKTYTEIVCEGLVNGQAS